MSSNTHKLRLGPLPKTETVKITITCTVVLKADLERYAAMHAQAYGEPVDALTLIPHMLEACEKVDATGKDGVLTVSIAKQAKAMPRRIRIGT